MVGCKAESVQFGGVQQGPGGGAGNDVGGLRGLGLWASMSGSGAAKATDLTTTEPCKECMMIGTAGFTAMQMVMELEDRPRSRGQDGSIQRTSAGQDETRLKDRAYRFNRVLQPPESPGHQDSPNLQFFSTGLELHRFALDSKPA